MSDDARALALAAAAAAGALQPSRAALWVGVGLAVVASLGRRALWLAAVALLASGLAQRSLDGLDDLRPGAVDGEVVLLGDPAPSFDGLRVDVRWGGRRLEASARGPAADSLRDRLAGEVVRLRGTTRPLSPDRPWLAARHVAGELRVLRVDGWRPGDGPSVAANGLRRTLVAGAAPLDDRARSLFTGLVIGDDRAQPADLADAFRGAGLTHLLAVSGQNVAFALALAGPLLRRLGLWPRLLATLSVIGLFGVMTRFEPSVLRASAMAGLAATMAMPGRPGGRLRVVGLAVTGLLLVDPLLVRATGFQLSVSASLAIVALAPRLAAAVPGPAPVREALGVTLAAQLGVAPVLLATFGPIPVASIPANLLCVPVAGAVMMWGLTAGLLAGVGGAPVSTLVHGPTDLALGWLEMVAKRTAGAPLGELDLPLVVALAAGLTALVLGRARPPLRHAGVLVITGALAVAVLSANAPPPLRSALAPGVVRWHSAGTDVVVLGGDGGRSTLSARVALEALRRAGVGAIDLLVVADDDVPEELVALVAGVHPAAATWRRTDGAAVADVGDLSVRIVAVPERLVVDAVPRGP